MRSSSAGDGGCHGNRFMAEAEAYGEGKGEAEADGEGQALIVAKFIKLIGAKFFYKGYEAGLEHPINETLESKSPLDTEGYDTHTASTVAGSPVDGAGFYNYAHGRAVGMAPTMRIAAYKICWKSGCYDSDILATFDEIPGGVMAHRHGSLLRLSDRPVAAASSPFPRLLSSLTSHKTPTDVSHPHTTHTPEFLRLSSVAGLLPAASGAVSDVVVRVLDTGIYPLNRGSFKPAGDGLGPPPSSFSGGCVSATAFNASAYCNNKLIGAKFFYKGYEAGLGHPINETLESKSPLDTEGHGTHTASTAAGSPVDGTGFYNYAHGRVVGMAPTARSPT
ncbi:hypothetical protein ZWY2020_035024 [Hordeum vulgare]|nr:hypothetical protein ZWY2020_035024 [Hordeum vulgare]